MVRYLLRLAVFAFAPVIAYPALASPCPPGIPPGVTCNGIEDYIYSAPPAGMPLSAGLRIPAAPSPMDNSLLYIPANLLATLNDPQVLTNKTIDCRSNICVNFPLPISAAPPLNLSGLSLSLAYDNTLSVNSGKLHVNSSGGGAVASVSGSGQITSAPTIGSVVVGSTGFSGGITIASACTGSGCTLVTSCETFVNGILSGFAVGACGGGGGGVNAVGRNGGGTVGRNGGGSVGRN